MFKFSIGLNKFDNLPAQCSAASFKEFAKDVLELVSPAKGGFYVCAPVSYGLHSDQKKYPGENHWRQQHLALPRRFLAFDFDGFETPEVWQELRSAFPWKGFFYTTSSHTPENPRARAFVELDTEVDHDEGVELGMAAQAYLETLVTSGKIDFDKSVYGSTQPVYTPVQGFTCFFVKGKALNVSDLLNGYRARNPSDAFDKPDVYTAPATPFWTEGEIIPSGVRNKTLLSIAGRYRAQGYAQPQIDALVLEANTNFCRPPLDEKEVLSIARRYEHQTAPNPDGFSIFTESQHNNDGPHNGDGPHPDDGPQTEHNQQSKTKGIFTLSEGDLSLPTKAPPPRDYVLADSVVKGTVIMVGGLGGTAKTTLVMQICIHSAINKNLGTLGIREGSSVLFLGEEPEDEKLRRFGGLCADLNDTERAKVSKRIRAFAAIGKDLRVTRELAGNPHPTMFVDEIVSLSLAHQASAGVDLSFIILDHARLVMAGDPNAADDVSQLTRVLAYIANKTQAVVVLIAHSPKSTMGKEGASDASEIFGSGAFTDNTRGTFILRTMRPDDAKKYAISEIDSKSFVCLANAKANYGASGGEWWFRKEALPDWQIAKLIPATLFNTKLFPQFSNLSKRIMDMVAAKPGKLTKSNVRQRACTKGELAASERDVRNALDRLVDEGELILETLTKGQKAERGLSANVREVLTLPSAG
jgi:hypothetical protein